MSKTIKQKIDTIKGWYASGTVPANCAVYDDKVIKGIQSKCKEICQHNKSNLLRGDFLSEVIQQGYSAATDFETPEDLGQSPYDFQTDVFQQNNAFEYFKLGEIVEEYGANNSMRNGLNKEQQKNLLDKFVQVYIPLMAKLNQNEKKFLKDILKLSGGVLSWFAPTFDSSLSADYLTKNVNTLEPILSDISGGKRNKNRTQKRNGNKRRNNNSRKQKRNNRSKKQNRNVSKKNNKSRKQNRK